MASGKETPRQKMINLMYLVFIAMLALNMSKEVLTAFGMMNEQVVESNINATERNKKFKQGLDEKADEQPGKYLSLKNKADSISTLAENLYQHIENIKTNSLVSVEDPTDYEIMDKSETIDEMFFNPESFTTEGKEFLNQMKVFREGVAEILKDNLSLQDIVQDATRKFSTDEVTNSEGLKLDWLEYHYQGYPLVASITKFTMLQADVKTIESELLSAMLQGKLKIEASLTNFDAIVVPDKTAFFSGDNFTGRIILGKNDKTLKADKVLINGVELDQSSMLTGQTILDFPAGAVGEREIAGEFQFKEGDSIITIPVNSTYAVVPKPNSATVSADKMNVVYQGVRNPFSISFAGIPDNKVDPLATPGLRKGKLVGKKERKSAGDYELDLRKMPTALKGKKTINVKVVGTLPSGERVVTEVPFRIKPIPSPLGSIDGETGSMSMNRADLASAIIDAQFNGFDFDLPLSVDNFKINIQG
ncbi:gliding motility protein GldM, partial [Flavobacteriaceae bacterium]|nr:gliding motility protein GldM [Flavobacteriaceae bacterium]